MPKCVLRPGEVIEKAVVVEIGEEPRAHIWEGLEELCSVVAPEDSSGAEIDPSVVVVIGPCSGGISQIQPEFVAALLKDRLGANHIAGKRYQD